MNNKVFIERINEALKDKPLMAKKETLNIVNTIYNDIYGKKKTISAYNIFVKEQTLKLKEEQPNLLGKEKKDYINNLWKTTKEIK
jgi:hypothetical protein